MARLMQNFVDRHGQRLVRFGLVGLSGVGVKTGVLWALITLLGVNSLVAAVVSSEISIITNFVLNDHWTFRDARSDISYLRRVANYHAVTLGGIVVSIALFAGLTEWFGMHYLLANLISIAAATFSNYALNMRFTWSPHLPSSAPPLVSIPEPATVE